MNKTINEYLKDLQEENNQNKRIDILFDLINYTEYNINSIFKELIKIKENLSATDFISIFMYSGRHYKDHDLFDDFELVSGKEL